MVAGNSDDALHKVDRGIQRIVEDDDVAALYLVIGQNPTRQVGVAEVQLVHQQVIANQQSILHGFGRNLERLRNERNNENRDDNDFHEPLDGFGPASVTW